ncbi:response regulator with CheY-like receiver domain and winged-helix DNA-binding domain [Xenococcus sp. PCC 7305]|uniref:response regulator n=1 Tax=Xenococcus sp. PCC 7305 TaxID=102125 RepID=UPI0002AD1970|nr:response regulator [Xenococcus sp. PCC 7305]ELS03555.1 response regulator with CheY-like receiver domain and winged-helix DNA-binding domain [Xenococcus sp. PCC 7305]
MTVETDEQPKIIFLVEDNKADIRLIEEALKNSSIFYKLVTVRNGVDAMFYLRREESYADALRPDLVILDLNLPKKDGREVLEEIKTDPQLKRIPVIILTTSSNEDDIHQSYELNANCYITKSRNLSQLFAIVKRIEEFWLATVTLPSK